MLFRYKKINIRSNFDRESQRLGYGLPFFFLNLVLFSKLYRGTTLQTMRNYNFKI